MEGNKDESERCIDIAEKFIASGQRDKALKYLNKAEKLYPSSKAKDLINNLTNSTSSPSSSSTTSTSTSNSNSTSSSSATTNASAEEAKSEENGDKGGGTTSGGTATGSATGGSNTSGPYRRTTSSNQTGSADSTEFTSSNCGEGDAKHLEYSTEQVELVKRIKRCKDYYEILNVTKDASDSELKKQYRKLALQFHPDKNKAPGAVEAFKAIGNAFAILSDPEKRKRYDLYGAEEQVQRRGRNRDEYSDFDYTRGFEADVTAEELFNMFFGGGFPSGRQGNVYMRRGNRWTRYHQQHDNHDSQSSDGSYSALLQMLPILILIFLSLMSSFFVSDPAYSLQRTQKYSLERHTRQLRITYFVKENFNSEYQGSLRRIEQQVEEDYITNLRASCIREKNYKESMLWRARNFGDSDLLRKANQLRTPSCDTLQGLYS